MHGALYMVLVLCVRPARPRPAWPVSRIVLVALGGTVPVVSFLVERRVVARERRRRLPDGPRQRVRRGLLTPAQQLRSRKDLISDEEKS